MSKEKREIDNIIEKIEEDYAHDLSLHLYSTHLLHQADILFPKKKWASWPVPMNEVPDPQQVLKYIDQENPQTVIKTSKTRQRSIYGITVNEDITDPTDNLRLELRALLEQKIHAKLKKRLQHNKNKNLDVPVEIESRLIDSVVDRMKSSIDETLDGVFEARLESKRKHEVRLMDWQDVLLAKLAADIANGVKIDTVWYRTLYLKLFEMFNYKYAYEKEDMELHEEQGNEDEEDVDDREEDEKEEEEEEDGFSLAEKAQEEYNGFKVALDTEELAEAVSCGVFQDLVEEIDENRKRKITGEEYSEYHDMEKWKRARLQQIAKISTEKKNVFFAMLEVEERKQIISFGRKNKRTHLEGLSLTSTEEAALQGVGLSLTEDSYVV